MAQYKCMEDIFYHDVLLGEKGEEVRVSEYILYNDKTNTQLNDHEYVRKLILDKKLVNVHSADLKDDNVNHPKHYTSHPSGIECIEVTRHYCFSVGNAIKYLWRAGLKTDEGRDSVEKEIEDLNKAIWYIKDRIKQLKKENGLDNK